MKLPTLSVSIFGVSACIPSCKQHDRQIFVERSPMSSSTKILCFLNLDGFDETFHGFLLKETDVMFSHGTFETATVIRF